MVKLLKRGKKDARANGEISEIREGDGAQPPDGQPTGAHAAAPEAQSPEAQSQEAQSPETQPTGPGPEPTGQGSEPAPPPSRPTYEMPGTVEFDPPISYEPAPEPPPPPRSTGNLLSRALGDPGEQSPEERDRIAAIEFEQAIAPVLDLMRASIPEASTPEEAARILGENQGEVTPDPQGGAYVPGDAFDADARVYYRLLRRNYEKNPRPSEKRSTSHHLHGVYGKLTGTKGW